MAPATPRKPSGIFCDYCGEEIQRYIAPSQYARHKHHFCSLKCLHLFQIGQLAPKRVVHKSIYQLKCNTCGFRDEDDEYHKGDVCPKCNLSYLTKENVLCVEKEANNG